MRLFWLLVFFSLYVGLAGRQTLAQDVPPLTPEATESLAPVSTITPERVPDGYTLAEPGFYLFTGGEAVPLPNLGYVRLGSRLPNYVPQTTKRQPSILIWSRDITPLQVTLNSFSGIVDIAVESLGNFLDITRSNATGIRPGTTLWAVDGIPVGASVEQAYWLLYGDAGSTVELTLLEGTEQRSLTITRQPHDRRSHRLNLSLWDEQTVLYAPSFPLPFGFYCLYAGSDWCFEVVSELDPVPLDTPMPISSPATCATEGGVVGVTSTRIRETPSVRGAVVMEIPQGTDVTICGETANRGYLYVHLEDGTEGWVAKQTINLDNRFAQLPVVEIAGSNSLEGVDTSEGTITALIPPTAVNAQVVIRSLTGVGDISVEAVELQNNGPTLDLLRWTLSDTQGNVYTFRPQRLFSGGRLTLNTRSGMDTPVMLFWGLNAPIWDSGDVGILRDNNGVVQSTFRITD